MKKEEPQSQPHMYNVMVRLRAESGMFVYAEDDHCHA